MNKIIDINIFFAENFFKGKPRNITKMHHCFSKQNFIYDMTSLHTIILTRQQFSKASPSVHEYEIRYWKSISFAFYIYSKFWLCIRPTNSRREIILQTIILPFELFIETRFLTQKIKEKIACVPFLFCACPRQQRVCNNLVIFRQKQISG